MVIKAGKEGFSSGRERRVMIFPTGGVEREEGEELNLGRKRGGGSKCFWVHDS